MSAERVAAAVEAAAARRLASADPLLPARSPPEQAFSGPSADPSACEALFTVSRTGPETDAGTGRELVAVARCAHWTGAPGSLDLVWGASRRFTLIPEIAGPDVAGALDRLIGQWRDHLASVPGAGDADTATVINWPSRDIGGLNVMLNRGLTPLNVIAARKSRPAAKSGLDRPEGLSIQRATAADIDVLTDLGLGEISYDAHFGGVIERRHARPALRSYLADLLAGPRPWVWVAERTGKPLGLLAAEPPSTATWIAPLTSLSPVAYLMSAYVEEAERGTGIGRALTEEFHRAAEAEGVAVVLLHYELFNPRSGPFWSQQGYRPLWTGLEARPASRLIGHSA